MKPTKKRKKRFIPLLVLLALLCIGGTELAVCCYAAPELFETITTPVLRTGKAVWDTAAHTTAKAFHTAEYTVKKITKSVSSTVSAAFAAEEEDPQVAGDPAIANDLPIADPTITELVTTDGGAERITGGTVSLVYYNQGDDAWANQLYGKDPIGKYGCGPTAMSMVISTLTDENYTPKEMADWASQHGYWASRSGSYLSIVSGTAAAFGLPCESLGRDCTAGDLQQSLASGGIAVALMGPGHFTKGGHFIVLRGATLDGGILVADPNSRDNSLTVWDAQTILDELSPSRTSGAPLWLLHAPNSTLSPAD